MGNRAKLKASQKKCKERKKEKVSIVDAKESSLEAKHKDAQIDKEEIEGGSLMKVDTELPNELMESVMDEFESDDEDHGDLMAALALSMQAMEGEEQVINQEGIHEGEEILKDGDKEKKDSEIKKSTEDGQNPVATDEVEDENCDDASSDYTDSDSSES